MQPEVKAPGIWSVIAASSAGTLIEWYDFYIFGSLATILAGQFFPKTNPTAGLLFILATFATGFVVRPFGAIFFGRMGDLVGRKHTFMLTLVMMGVSTFAMALVPTYETIGVFAPLIVLILRLVQGLALGGEYGGAAIYVGEHAPNERRGYYTSFIQTTATLGLFVSLLVILVTRGYLGEAAFGDWGWRVPFALSLVLVVFSYLIRMRMKESPVFAEIKARGQTSTSPLRESFANPKNRRLVLIALFGATAGQGVIWYTGQFYALYFLQTVMNVSGPVANKIVAWALIFGTPFFVVFGALSDRIGRRNLIVPGCLLAAILYFPIYSAMYSTLPAVGTLGPAQVVSVASKADHSTGKVTPTKTETWVVDSNKYKMTTPGSATSAKPKIEVTPSAQNYWLLVALVFVQVLLVTMVYGPIAAFLIELFPPKIRYTSLSLPYHLGNGVFGGLVPFIGTALVSATGFHLAGLYYPVIVALVTFVVGAIFVREVRRPDGFLETASTDQDQSS